MGESREFDNWSGYGHGHGRQSGERSTEHLIASTPVQDLRGLSVRFHIFIDDRFRISGICRHNFNNRFRTFGVCRYHFTSSSTTGSRPSGSAGITSLPLRLLGPGPSGSAGTTSLPSITSSTNRSRIFGICRATFPVDDSPLVYVIQRPRFGGIEGVSTPITTITGLDIAIIHGKTPSSTGRAMTFVTLVFVTGKPFCLFRGRAHSVWGDRGRFSWQQQRLGNSTLCGFGFEFCCVVLNCLLRACVRLFVCLFVCLSVGWFGWLVG